VAALVISLAGASIAATGMPVVSSAVASSTVLRTIDRLTPAPVAGALAQLRGFVLDEGLPALGELLETGPVTIQPVDLADPELAAAAASVARVSGTAFACGRSLTGSGFVIAPGRVLTNAHVLAGVTTPVVELPGLTARDGTIVYFDPVDDLAVLAVPGLNAPPLVLTQTAADGQEGVINGYPFGGPFVTSPAEVLSIDTAQVFDIYRSSQNPREVYTLAAEVNVGDSGGPFLTTDGEVAGVVFAKAANTENVGYAMTMAELDPVAAQAPSLTEPVGSGECSRG